MRLQYVGPISELQGKTALVWTDGHQYTGFTVPIVVAQFDDNIMFNGQRMDLGWHPFIAEHFQPVTPTGKKPIF